MKRFHEFYIEKEVLAKADHLPVNMVKEATRCILSGMDYTETRDYFISQSAKINKREYEEIRSRIESAAQTITESKKGKKGKKSWIQGAFKDVKARGTEGVCTGDKFGSESCPAGTKRNNMAKNLRKIAKKGKKKKKEE